MHLLVHLRAALPEDCPAFENEPPELLETINEFQADCGGTLRAESISVMKRKFSKEDAYQHFHIRLKERCVSNDAFNFKNAHSKLLCPLQRV